MSTTERAPEVTDRLYRVEPPMSYADALRLAREVITDYVCDAGPGPVERAEEWDEPTSPLRRAYDRLGYLMAGLREGRIGTLEPLDRSV